MRFLRPAAALSFGLAALPAPAAFASHTAGATVVVLNGLAGDVESERAYEEQMRALLERLARPGSRPKTLVVLTDAPARVALPSGLEARVDTISRAAVTALARTLPADAPLVVFAWGHGGMQGATPVFHVRGPRVTPDDLAAVAGPRPTLAWLFFRGSGRFAALLAGPARSIFSSDDAVASSSDPIGFERLLDAWRTREEDGFDALAAAVGRQTAAWYAGQGIARTEEPTLRAGTAAPRGLADAPVETASGTPAAPATPPDAWKDIRAVSPADFPGAAAVVLRRHVRTTIADSPAVVQEVDEFVQILTPAGASAADVAVAYSPPSETVRFDDCELRRPDGTFVRLAPEDVRDAGAPPPDGYARPQQRFFSLPGAVPGAIVRVHRTSEWRRFPLPGVLLDVPVADALPVRELRIEVRSKAGAPLHHVFTDGVARAPAEERTTYGIARSWTLRDLPATPPDPLAPPETAPRLLLSTFADWPAFAAWYGRIIREADQLTPELRAKSDELVKGAASDREKVERVYRYVTGLRYVAVPLGVNSHRPHAAANVLKNGFGDCKDKANLLNALLRAQGLTADLVLVPRFAQAYPEAPGAGFNHAISRVALGGTHVFLDSTDPDARFGLLPPGDPGRRVLVIDGRTSALTELPSPRPEDHRVVVTGTLGPAEDGLAGTLTVRPVGYWDYALRAGARASATTPTFPLWDDAYRPVAGVFALVRQGYSDPSDLAVPFEWRAEGTWAGTASALPGGARLQRVPFVLPSEWEDALHARRSGVRLHYGYPLVLEQEVTLATPAGARAELPAAREQAEGPLRFRLSFAARGAGVVATLRVEVASGELTAEQSTGFVRGLRALWNALSEGIVYRTS
jgi:transglutaminase-like putative cysteine protease